MADSQDFRKALDDMWELHQLKNKDYGAQNDPYRNVRSGADWGVDPWVSAMIRQGDKVKRLQKYAQTKELANESAEDSLIDNAVYAVIALVLWREQHHEKREQRTFTPVEEATIERIDKSLLDGRAILPLKTNA
jgi:hypothetical protein